MEVRKQLDSLRRCQSLEEVQRLHEAGEHEKVVQLLLSAQQKDKVSAQPAIASWPAMGAWMK